MHVTVFFLSSRWLRHHASGISVSSHSRSRRLQKSLCKRDMETVRFAGSTHFPTFCFWTPASTDATCFQLVTVRLGNHLRCKRSAEGWMIQCIQVDDDRARSICYLFASLCQFRWKQMHPNGFVKLIPDKRRRHQSICCEHNGSEMRNRRMIQPAASMTGS